MATVLPVEPLRDSVVLLYCCRDEIVIDNENNLMISRKRGRTEKPNEETFIYSTGFIISDCPQVTIIGTAASAFRGRPYVAVERFGSDKRVVASRNIFFPKSVEGEGRFEFAIVYCMPGFSVTDGSSRLKVCESAVQTWINKSEYVKIIHHPCIYLKFSVDKGRVSYYCRKMGDFLDDIQRQCKVIGNNKIDNDVFPPIRDWRGRYLQLDIRGSLESMGAPVINCDGEVAGIMVYRFFNQSRSYGFALHSGLMKLALKEIVTKLMDNRNIDISKWKWSELVDWLETCLIQRKNIDPY